jgi:hypothetical protein
MTKTYKLRLGRLIGTFDMKGVGHDLDLIEWTEPVTYATDDRDEIDRAALDMLAAHPTYVRVEVTPV